ncbi:MAG: glycerate kinase [Sediminibacterium sp.]|jgi:glycerate 2-kinase
MHILIAPNAFKNSISAQQAADAIQLGLANSGLKHSVECFPIGDGGDGTAALILQKINGQQYNTIVQDPLGRNINATYSIIQEGTVGLIEMAEASGLKRLSPNEYSPLTASSFGTGQLMLAALNKGVKKIILTIGGSATVDGGTGILRALGARFLNAAGVELTILPKQLNELTFVDTTTLDSRLINCDISILCDVTNTLIGAQGAAAVFGPQKGATEKEVEILDSLLTHFAAISLQQTGINLLDINGGGAAGGVSAGLYGYLRANLVNGIDYFLELTNFKTAINKANLLITAEGSIDNQTLQGKGPIGVAKMAKALGIPVIGLAGQIPTNISEALQFYFDILISINKVPTSLQDALNATAANLTLTATEIGNKLALNK